VRTFQVANRNGLRMNVQDFRPQEEMPNGRGYQFGTVETGNVQTTFSRPLLMRGEPCGF